MFISYFNFPIAFLWFEYNVLALYWLLRWTIVPRTALDQTHAPLGSGLGNILPARGQ
jgi:hypothetical protein